MPIAYEIEPRQRRVTSRAWGVLTDAEVRQHSERLRGDPAFDPTYWQSTDLRDVTSLEVSAVTLAALAAKPAYAPGARRAIIASRDAHHSLASLFASYAAARRQDVRVFRDPREAEVWLELAEYAAAAERARAFVAVMTGLPDSRRAELARRLAAMDWAPHRHAEAATRLALRESAAKRLLTPVLWELERNIAARLTRSLVRDAVRAAARALLVAGEPGTHAHADTLLAPFRGFVPIDAR